MLKMLRLELTGVRLQLAGLGMLSMGNILLRMLSMGNIFYMLQVIAVDITALNQKIINGYHFCQTLT